MRPVVVVKRLAPLKVILRRQLGQWTTTNGLRSGDCTSNKGAPSQPDDGTSLQPDAGTYLQPDKGTSFLPAEGTTVQKDAGTSWQPDEGTSWQPDEGTSLQLDKGTSFLPAEETTVQKDAGTSSRPDEGTSLQPDEGTSSQPDEGTTVQPDARTSLQTVQEQAASELDESEDASESNKSENASESNESEDASESDKSEDDDSDEDFCPEETSFPSDKGTSSQSDKVDSSQPDEGTPLQPDAGTSLHPDEGTSLQPDAGTSLQQDEGTSFLPAEGTSLQPDAGTSLQPDEGTSLQPDKGTFFLTAEETTVQKDAGTSSRPDEGTSLQPDEGTSLQPDASMSLQTVQEKAASESDESENSSESNGSEDASESDESEDDDSDEDFCPEETSFPSDKGTSSQPDEVTSLQPDKGTSFQPAEGTSVQEDATDKISENDGQILSNIETVILRTSPVVGGTAPLHADAFDVELCEETTNSGNLQSSTSVSAGNNLNPRNSGTVQADSASDHCEKDASDKDFSSEKASYSPDEGTSFQRDEGSSSKADEGSSSKADEGTPFQLDKKTSLQPDEVSSVQQAAFDIFQNNGLILYNILSVDQNNTVIQRVSLEDVVGVQLDSNAVYEELKQANPHYEILPTSTSDSAALSPQSRKPKTVLEQPVSEPDQTEDHDFEENFFPEKTLFQPDEGTSFKRGEGTSSEPISHSTAYSLRPRNSQTVQEQAASESDESKDASESDESEDASESDESEDDDSDEDFCPEETSFLSDKGTSSQSDKGHSSQSDEGRSSQPDAGTPLHPDEGTSLQPDEGTSLQPDEGSFQQAEIDDSSRNDGPSTETKTEKPSGNFCFFCKKLIPNKIGRHYQEVHKEEKIVKDIKSLSGKDKLQALELLRRRGNFLLNEQGKDGQPVKVVRRLLQEENSDTVVCCPHCLGALAKANIYKHIPRCPAAPQKLKFSHTKTLNLRRVQSSSERNDKFEDFMTNIAPHMSKDAVANQVLKDECIKLYGMMLLETHREQRHLMNYISTKCREVARLVLSANKLDPGVQCLKDVLNPLKWDLFVQAALEAAGFDKSKNQFGTPSLALKIGYSVTHIINILLIECIKTGDEEEEKRLKRFKLLLEQDWPKRVSSKALKTLYNCKFNKPNAIPLAEDVLKLNNYLKEKIAAFCKKLCEDSTNAIFYDSLCKSVATYLLVFNRRRPGELSRLLLDAYGKKRSGVKEDEISKSLSESERLLAESLAILEIRGKKGRKVPVLLNKCAQEAIDLLISCRRKCGVKPDNPYLFALPGSDTSVNLTVTLHDFVSASQVEKPEFLTATKLRKHVATSCQLLDLAENDLENLATFMGHNIDVHRDFYRLPSDATQLARISKIFTLLDRGELHVQQGQSLHGIQVTPDDVVDSCSSGDDADEPGTAKKKSAARRRRKHDSESDEEFFIPKKQKPSKSTRPKRRVKTDRHSWSEQQKEAIIRQFNQSILVLRVPNKAECEAAKKKETCLNDLPWLKIKFFVKNLIDKKKVKLSPLKFQRKV